MLEIQLRFTVASFYGQFNVKEKHFHFKLVKRLSFMVKIPAVAQLSRI